MKVGGVDRLTDTKLYTGAHKERFDESGKGKGIEGRENVTDNSGYVGAYKGSGTYDKKWRLFSAYQAFSTEMDNKNDSYIRKLFTVTIRTIESLI